jgi:hypothetical protein
VSVLLDGLGAEEVGVVLRKLAGEVLPLAIGQGRLPTLGVGVAVEVARLLEVTAHLLRSTQVPAVLHTDSEHRLHAALRHDPGMPPAALNPSDTQPRYERPGRAEPRGRHLDETAPGHSGLCSTAAQR